MTSRNTAIAVGTGVAAFAVIALAMRARAEPPYDPWVYDLNEDGVISLAELEVAIFDHASGLLPIAHLAVVAGACYERPSPFDPWWYDFNGDGLISKQEVDIAAVDWQNGLITMSQMLQVVNLHNFPG